MKAIFQKHKQFLIREHMELGFRGYPPMFHRHGELVYVTKGQIKTTVDGIEHTLEAGELSVVFPYVTHSYEAAPEAEALVLMVAPEAAIFDNTLRTKRPQSPFMDGRPFEGMLRRCAELISKGKIKTALSYLNAVLGEFLEQTQLLEADHADRDVAIRVLDYCTTHFTQEITLRQVAQALYVSESYLSKIFARKFKCSFRQYINQLRIDRAKSLLEDPKLSILEVMNESGFQNQSSFNRVFKELCGVSPRQYKNSLK